jgi:mRNA interferase HigB
MHVLTYSRLRQFAKDHPDASEPLDAWYHIVKRKTYSTSHEVRSDFGSADFIGKGRVVFDIGGNKYRLVVKMEYKWGKVFVRHIVTHEVYDRLTKSGSL